MDAYITKGTLCCCRHGLLDVTRPWSGALYFATGRPAADLTALRLTKVEESLFETLQRLTAAAKLLSDWAMVPGEKWQRDRQGERAQERTGCHPYSSRATRSAKCCG